MNTECMYVLKKGDMEIIRRICSEITLRATLTNSELEPTYVGKAVKDFKVTPDYDGNGHKFTVKKGQIIIWAAGKLHSMYELRPKGAQIGFPYRLNKEYFPDKVGELVQDILKYDSKNDSFEVI